MGKIIMPGQEDSPNDWVNVSLKINPKTGEIHATGGDTLPAPPGVESTYIGLEIIKNMIHNILSFNKFQHLSMRTKKYDDKYRLMYPTLGLAGEAGELANKVKKIFRDDGGKITQEKAEQIAGELGDVLWYIAAVAHDLEIPLEVIAIQNIQKLEKRLQEDKIKGEGDNR